VAAAQGISRGRAAGQLRYGLASAERLPKLVAVFAAGDVDFRVISAAVFRSELTTDDNAMTRLDTWLARNASRWSQRSYNKIVEVVYYWDPEVGAGRGAGGAGNRRWSLHQRLAAALRDGRDLGQGSSPTENVL
jgi:Domain of unknown function (DUF222)